MANPSPFGFCRDCGSWSGTPNHPLDPPDTVRQCRAPRFYDDVMQVPVAEYAGAAVVTGDGSIIEPELHTGPNFGCAMFTPRIEPTE